MIKKMRILFVLFIALPLVLSLSTQQKNSQIKTFLEFRESLEHNLGEFKAKTEEDKDKILNELDISILDLKEKIKTDISEKKEKPKEKIRLLIEKGIELSKYLKYKECHKEDANCQYCMNNKKRWMNNLIEVVEDNFGQCQALEHLTNLTII